jgi:hypothetical protein
MAKKGAAAAEVIDVTENVELVETRDDGGAIAAFVGNLRQFFTQARTLEAQAKVTLAKAQQLTLPKTADQDVYLQTFVKEANAHRKLVAEHWEITSVIHRFHRRLTAARDRGVQMDEQAALIANQLHNRYVEEEKRKAAAETERRRREAEARERQDRIRQQEALEAQALSAEANSPDLSEREQAFVDYVFAGNNPAYAAQRAGYKDFAAQGLRLAASEKIQLALAAKQQARVARDQAEAVKRAPIVVEHEEVKPDIKRATGAVTRTTHSAEVLDLNRLRDAAFEGGYGIPRDLFVVDVAKLNGYARDLQQQIERWPGVRYIKKTQVV